MSTPYYAPYPSSPTESTYSTGESSTSSPTVSQYRYSPGRQVPSPSTPVAPSGTCSSDDQSSQNGDYTVTHDRRGRVTSSSSISKLDISHPYARLYAKKEEGKRRKIWNHALEKALFSPYELCVFRFLRGFIFSWRLIMATFSDPRWGRLTGELSTWRVWRPMSIDSTPNFSGRINILFLRHRY